MKIHSVLFFCGFMIVSSINTSLGKPYTSNIGGADEDVNDGFVFSALPLKIILEHQLRAVKASKYSIAVQTQPELLDKTFKYIAKTSDGSPDNICSESEFRKKVSAEEMAKIFGSGVNQEEDVARLQKIYDTIKDCEFVKVRSSKLWGPLWHCLNRLFLFFVFG